MQRNRSPAATLATLALAACAGNGEGLDENGRPDDGATPPLTADFDSIQQNVFTPICTACHAGAAAPLGLSLEAGVSYAQLVGVPSVEVPGLMRVTPGDPDGSYLVHKIEGRAEVGDRMPLGGPPLPQATIDVIRQWILDGAQAPALTQPAKAAPSLLAVTQVTAALLSGRPHQIIVAADAELDTSLIHAGSVTLLRSGGDGTFDDGNETAVEGLSIRVTTLAPTTMVIQLPAAMPATDRFELRFAGTGPAPIAGRDAVVIDGDEDGEPGGDFVLEFDLGGAR